MSAALHNHINKLIKLTRKEDIDRILEYFEQREFRKKDNLLVKDKVCDRNFFVAEGCLRMFFINDKGTEHTTQFAIENWWLSDYSSYGSEKPSEYFIQAVEGTTVLSITYHKQEEMLKKYPEMERYFRLIHQRVHAATQFRIKGLYDLSREEAYFRFVKRFPEFVNRIPQYLLASYLGFTPEYLSEIRSKIRS